MLSNLVPTKRLPGGSALRLQAPWAGLGESSLDPGCKKQVGFVHCMPFNRFISSLCQVIRAFKVNSGRMRKCKLEGIAKERCELFANLVIKCHLEGWLENMLVIKL